MTSSPIGSYPTPVERVLVGSGAGSGANALWIKRDDVTHADYGGNKVRKLEHVLQEAAQKGHRKLLTVGAAGSHHVLATALFGQRAGFEVHAVLVPQPKTPAGPTNLRAALAQGLRPHVASNWVTAGAKLAALRDDATTFVAVGGSDIPGTRGYVDAAHELARQVEAGELPEPSRIFVTLGSGGTAVGLALGLAQTKLKTRVVGVCIADPAAVIRKYARWLLGRVAALIAPDARGRVAKAALERLTFSREFLGKGYGHATDAGAAATRAARSVGITLDPTYTAKCFAAVLSALEGTEPTASTPVSGVSGDSGDGEPLLYWHTLSSAPLEPLLVGAPPELPPELERLFR